MLWDFFGSLISWTTLIEPNFASFFGFKVFDHELLIYIQVLQLFEVEVQIILTLAMQKILNQK
jgi:hypothetical protein